jgi:hypothetical protein
MLSTRSGRYVEGQRRSWNSKVSELLADIDAPGAGSEVGVQAVAGRLDRNAGRRLQRERHGSKGRGERRTLRTIR